MFEYILSHEKLRYNLPAAAMLYNIKESKLQSMIDEYITSGCYVVASKMNFEEEI